jgi:hypothetical protein
MVIPVLLNIAVEIIVFLLCLYCFIYCTNPTILVNIIIKKVIPMGTTSIIQIISRLL